VGFDPELAAASVAELAAITDEQLAADVQVGLAHVLEAWATWRSDPMFPRAGHPRASLNRDRDVLVAKVAAQIEALPDNADLDTLVNVARRLLNPAWGLGSRGEQTVAEAVERLRQAAIHRPTLVKESRAIAKAVSDPRHSADS
jgi:hypothetical protein